jgi:hypothetical protein
MSFWENLDYEIVVQSISADLCNAEVMGYLPQIKKRHNVAFLPKIHHLYSWPLKIAGYKWLTPKNKLFIISEWADTEWIVMYDEPILFMWKKWNFDDWFIKKCGVKIRTSSEWFEFIENELPYIRVIWNFDEIYFFRVWKNETVKNLYKLLSTVTKLWNVIFLSDLHTWLSLVECEKFDEDALTDADKCDIFMLNLLFWLALVQKHKLRVIWYGNTAYLNWNKKDTTGYCTIMI